MNNKAGSLSKNTNIMTIRVPLDLKERLEKQARFQGVSLNQLANYLLNLELNQFEALMKLENRLASSKISTLKSKVNSILSNIPCRKVPEWDRI
jgi:hypothetical protein